MNLSIDKDEKGKLTWSGFTWIPQERWGRVHESKSWAYYSPECVNVDSDGNLLLDIHYRPAIVDGYESKYAMGLLSSAGDPTKFKFGRYSWVAKLPKGKNLWPGLWMWAGPWPPEIDVVEAWTNKKGGYFRSNYKWQPFVWNLQTNYYMPSAMGNNAKCWSICKSGFKDPAEHFIKYELVWEPNQLEFIYDGKLIRKVKDSGFMIYLNKSTPKGMDIIMNLHPTREFNEQISNPLIIKSFKYED